MSPDSGSILRGDSFWEVQFALIVSPGGGCGCILEVEGDGFVTAAATMRSVFEAYPNPDTCNSLPRNPVQDHGEICYREKPCTLHPAPYTLHPTPCTLHPSPHTLHPAPCTLHPAPYTLRPASYTLHPALCTLHPAPCTLHPAPCTLHPKTSRLPQPQSLSRS